MIYVKFPFLSFTRIQNHYCVRKVRKVSFFLKDRRPPQRSNGLTTERRGVFWYIGKSSIRTIPYKKAPPVRKPPIFSTRGAFLLEKKFRKLF